MVRTRGNTAARERAKSDMHAAARFQGRPAHVIFNFISQSSLSMPVSDFKYQMCSSIRVFREDMSRMVSYMYVRRAVCANFANSHA
jgi:hypothetical protein